MKKIKIRENMVLCLLDVSSCIPTIFLLFIFSFNNSFLIIQEEGSRDKLKKNKTIIHCSKNVYVKEHYSSKRTFH